MNLKSLILIMLLAVVCGSGCITLKKLSIFNGMVSLEYGATAVPTQYRLISYEKNAEGKAFDLLHAERDPSVFGTDKPEENPETPVISP